MDTDQLIRKLGLRLGQKAFTLHAPVGYAEFLHVPEAVDSVTDLDSNFDWVQAFYIDGLVLESEIATLKQQLAKNGQLWISWPKKTSSLASTLHDEGVRTIGLDAGLVDVKVASINETWSGLKFVLPLADR
jgi:hypothetical protein